MEEDLKKLPLSLQKSRLLFQGTRFDVRGLEFEGKGKKIKREVVIHPGAVVILPLLDENHVVMIRNERFAVGETLWELPAGTLETGEHPQNTAERELAEETGYTARQMTELLTFYTSPGICNELMYVYRADDLTSSRQRLDDSENITVEVINWDHLHHMIKKGIIRDGKTLTTLLFYQAYFR